MVVTQQGKTVKQGIPVSAKPPEDPAVSATAAATKKVKQVIREAEKKTAFQSGSW
jgi:hypothetical protein